MKITFEMHIDSLNDITVKAISDYFTGNLNTANDYNRAGLLHPYVEGCLSDPFSRLDLKFTIEETIYDDRYALSDTAPVFEDEDEEETYAQFLINNPGLVSKCK